MREITSIIDDLIHERMSCSSTTSSCLDDSRVLGGIEGRDLHQSKNASMTWNDTSCPQHTRVTQPREIELTRRRKNSIYSYKRRLKPLPRVKENK
jgi:hypothetical protein